MQIKKLTWKFLIKLCDTWTPSCSSQPTGESLPWNLATVLLGKLLTLKLDAANLLAAVLLGERVAVLLLHTVAGKSKR